VPGERISTVPHRTALMILSQAARVQGEEGGNKKRGTRLPEQFKEIAGTATRECFGQSEVADTTELTDALWRHEQEQLDLAYSCLLVATGQRAELATLGARCSSVMAEEMRCVRMCMCVCLGAWCVGEWVQTYMGPTRCARFHRVLVTTS